MRETLTLKAADSVGTPVITSRQRNEESGRNIFSKAEATAIREAQNGELAIYLSLEFLSQHVPFQSLKYTNILRSTMLERRNEFCFWTHPIFCPFLFINSTPTRS